MKSLGQLLLGLLMAAGSSLLVLAAASLALVEGEFRSSVPGTTPAQPSATGPALTQTTRTPFTLTPTQAQPTTCPTPDGWSPYVVQPGDTLESLAEQVNLTADQIKKANCLSSTSLIPNTILYLPFAQATATAPIQLPTLQPSQTLAPSMTPIPCGPPRGWIIYIVRPGDTLFRLSLAYGVSQYELQTANCMIGTQLRAGQTLFVPNVPTRAPVFTSTPTEQPIPTDTPEPPTEVPPTEEPSPTTEPSPTEPTQTYTPEPSATPTNTSTVAPTVTETETAGNATQSPPGSVELETPTPETTQEE